MSTTRSARRSLLALAGAAAGVVTLVAAALPAAATAPAPAPGNVPGVASTGGGAAEPQFVVFYRGAANQLVSKLSGATVELGGALTSGPAAVTSSATEFVDVSVFARGTDNAIWTRRYSDGSGEWSPWAGLGGRSLGAPGATCVGAAGSASRVYVRGGDDAVWRKIGNGAWTRLGGVLASDPVPVPASGGACAPAEEVFALGTDRAVWSYRGGSWSKVGGIAVGSPAAIRLPDGETDVVARAGNALWIARRPAGAPWTGFARINGPAVSSSPTGSTLVTTSGAVTRRLAVLAADGQLYGGANAAGDSLWSWGAVS